MKMKTLSIVLGAVVLAGCASNQADEPDVDMVDCKIIGESEVAGLFDRWNNSLQTGDPKKVVENYAENSILLPTVSNTPRLTAKEKEDYFEYFLEDGPFGTIDKRFVEIGCNSVVDAGLYTFNFTETGESVSARYSYTYSWDGSEWLITSHHSSAMPE